MLRNRLKYALTRREVQSILMNRLVAVDGKVRTDGTYPAGFQDVISIAKTNENFRLLYDVKGRFAIHKISAAEAKYKLCQVRSVALGKGGIPYIVTHDGRTFRYPDPTIKEHDTVKLNLETNKLEDIIKFETGNVAMVTFGKNTGRVGVIIQKEAHHGGFNIIHMQDKAGHEFTTRSKNVFVVGQGKKAAMSLPRGHGVRLSNADDRAKRLKANRK
jgi:small subunit ribosomal protein S4e